MALRNQYTTADYIEWDEAMNLVRRLYRDGDYRMSLLIGCGCFFGLRFSDLRILRWEQVLSDTGSFAINEKKTGKRREIKVNKGFQRHILDCWQAGSYKAMLPQQIRNSINLADGESPS